MPAYDEWPNLAELSPVLNQLMCESADNIRWFVICEPREPDEMEQLTRRFLSDFSGVLSPRPRNKASFADAIQIGLELIQEDDEVVIFLDADQSHNPLRIPDLIEVLKQDPDVDVSIASRYVAGGTTDNSRTLRAMSKTVNLLYRAVLGLNAYDISTNFKCFRAHLLRGVQLKSINFEAVEELLMHAKARSEANLKSFRLVEIPDHFAVRKHGKSKRRLGQFIGTYLISLMSMKRSVQRQYRQPPTASGGR